MKLRIAVRDLVTHAFRSGDIGFSFGSAGRNVDAIRAHQKIQRSRPEGYQPEVPVTLEIVFDDLLLTVSGRMDGLFDTPEGSVVEEIKTTVVNPDRLNFGTADLHWAQLKCYGHMWAAAKKLTAVHLQLTYVNMDTGAVTSDRRTFEACELAAFFTEAVTLFLSWARSLCAWKTLRNATIAALPFPFSNYRAGQRAMAVAVFRTIRDGGQLLVHAATGIGKTLAAIFPSIKALGEERVSKILFLTARTTGKQAAQTAIGQLREKGLRLKSLTLTARDRICPHPEAHCNAEECPKAKGHFDRIRAATQSIFQKDDWTRDMVLTFSELHGVCPFEFSLDLALAADVVICDYNYAFDPRVYLRRFFDEPTDKYAFLVDEAHNLVDRGREMFSANLKKSETLAAHRAIGKALPRLQKVIGKVTAWFVKARRSHPGPDSSAALPMDLIPLLWRAVHEIERWLLTEEKSSFRDAVTDLYYTITGFLGIAEGYDESYATCHTPGDDGEFTVRLFCIDPSHRLKAALSRGDAVVLFSGTFTPFSYFKSILGCRKDTANLFLPSPFPPENRCILIHQAISTRYRHRKASREEVGRLIIESCRKKTGNYLIFFPSYAYLDMVRPFLESWRPEGVILVQQPEMTERQREVFVNAFSPDHTRPVMGLAVMGGVFGEGIDLLGDRLTGAVIVGVGLPAVCIERELIRAYFESLDGSGFDFAYRFPGMNRVLQAAGRVIRSGGDRGVIVLVDERFGHRPYRVLLPPDWRIRGVRTIPQMVSEISIFWGEPASEAIWKNSLNGPDHQGNGHQGSQCAPEVAEHHHQ